MQEKEIGHVMDYFTHVGVVAIELTDELAIGNIVHFFGHTTDFTQKVESIQIEHHNVTRAKAGDKVGIRVNERVRQHDKVYKVLSGTEMNV
jgi:translation elongation factor EF-1alpha